MDTQEWQQNGKTKIPQTIASMAIRQLSVMLLFTPDITIHLMSHHFPLLSILNFMQKEIHSVRDRKGKKLQILAYATTLSSVWKNSALPYTSDPILIQKLVDLFVTETIAYASMKKDQNDSEDTDTESGFDRSDSEQDIGEDEDIDYRIPHRKLLAELEAAGAFDNDDDDDDDNPTENAINHHNGKSEDDENDEDDEDDEEDEDDVEDDEEEYLEPE